MISVGPHNARKKKKNGGKMRTYAIISDDAKDITLSGSKSHRPYCETILKNYNISKDKTKIVGEELIYTFIEYPEPEDFEVVDPSMIIEKKFLFWKWKRIENGWTLMKMTKNSTYKNSKGVRVLELEEKNEY